MGWLALFRALLTAINFVAEIVRDKQLMDAGEAKATAKALAVLQTRLGIAKEVEAETAKMSDAELDRELSGAD
jgi:hypothetical protein